MTTAVEMPLSESVEGETAAIRDRLGDRTIVLIGMMGAGKSSLGKRLAARLGLPFVDADSEIEAAANATIAEIFERYGEAHFREGERRVIHRLLDGAPKVLATGGGAFMNAETRAEIAKTAIAIWLKADFEVLLARVRRRTNRPLLNNSDPETTLRRLMEERYPIYEEAPIHVVSRDVAHEIVVADIMAALSDYLGVRPAEEGSSVTTFKEPTGIRVDLGKRSYDILIGDGLLADAGGLIAERMPGVRAAIVTDRNVAQFHLPALSASLDRVGIGHVAIEIDPGEASKSFSALEMVVDGILAGKLERGDIIIGFGGGVVGDLAGFAGAVARRGMRIVQIPTTLLAQVDSSVGGKTGINSRHGKNLVGAFLQPSLVVADTSILGTLPKREFRAGYAEVAKYGLINDSGFFAWLEANWRAVFAGPGPELEEAIAVSCRAKAAIVGADELESGDRALLNLGHTFGHALEAATFYSDRLIHGEGVAIGIVLAHAFSARLGLAPAEDRERVEAHFRSVGLPTRISEIPGPKQDAGTLLGHIAQDKKVSRGKLTFILTRGIGEAFIAKDVSPDDVRAFLEQAVTA